MIKTACLFIFIIILCLSAIAFTDSSDLSDNLENSIKNLSDQAEKYKDELSGQAKTDPNAADRLKKLINEDGRIDGNKYFQQISDNAKDKASEDLAKATLRAISIAADSYSMHNNNQYPADEKDLTGGSPALLERSYCGTTVSGYSYVCNFSKTGYTVTATSDSGMPSYTIRTGGEMTP